MFKKKNTDSILSVFTKTMDELEAHARGQDVDVDTFTTVASLASARAASAYAEAKKARDAAAKIKGLFSGSGD